MLLSLQAGDLNAAPFGPPPDAPRWAAPWLAAAIAPNLLLGTLFVGPFNNADASLPRAPVRLEQSWTQNLLLTTLSEPDAAPFLNFDSRLPAAPIRLEQTWTQSLALTTLTQTPVAVAVAHQIRIIAPRLEQSWTQNLLETTLAPLYPSPVTDWPLPKAPPRLEQTWTQSLALTTLTQTPTVVPPSQQQAPRAAPRLEQTWTQNLLESTLGTPPPMPFANFDWPLPRVASQFRASAPYGGPQPVVSTVLPFANYDWPLPVAQPRLEQTWTFEYVISTQMPFANYDWRLPIVASSFRASNSFGGPQPPGQPAVTTLHEIGLGFNLLRLGGRVGGN